MTKVQAIVKVIQDNGGQANWQHIYSQIGRYYRGAMGKSTIGQAGIRGVLYREIRNGRTFKQVAPATFGLR